MQVNNANVVRDELSKVGNVKDLETDGDVWHVEFENTQLNFDVPLDIVSGVNVKQMWTKTDVKPHDTLAVNVTFEL